MEKKIICAAFVLVAVVLICAGIFYAVTWVYLGLAFAPRVVVYTALFLVGGVWMLRLARQAQND